MIKVLTSIGLRLSASFFILPYNLFLSRAGRLVQCWGICQKSL